MINNDTILKSTFITCCFLFLNSIELSAQLDIPAGLNAQGYDSHIELNWFKNAEPNLSGYRIYRAEDSINFELITFIPQSSNSYIDFIGEQDKIFQYKITAINTSNEESGFSDAQTAFTFEMTDEELLTMVQKYTFRYFWDFAHPVSGLTRERNTTSIVTTGGSGFGVMAILVGIKQGFISYEEGVERLLKIVSFLESADRFHGVYPHWMNGATGAVIPFSEFDDGGDLVETAFLIQGLLTARQCISGDTEDEILLREKITQIWKDVDWNWYRKTVQKVLYWHWSPNYGWEINHQIRGFNEAHIVYILAIASPTHNVPATLYHNGWAGGNYTNGNTYYDLPLEVGGFNGGPLFFSHYSYLGFDPRYKKDAYTNYFNRNVNHTLINRNYCIDNPKNYAGYGPESWGLTASDDPWGYLAHEPTSARDNGTITPTAALSSFPYTPNLSMKALKHFYRDYGDRLWGKFGFYDAFNLDQDWYASSYLAIDQGPIIGMIENYRSNLLWDCFMANPEIDAALDAMGFETDSTYVTNIEQNQSNIPYIEIYPNPNLSGQLSVEFAVLNSTSVEISITDFHGNRVLRTERKNIPMGKNKLALNLSEFSAGIYMVQINGELFSLTKKLVIIR